MQIILSDDLAVVTAEIIAHKGMLTQNVFEIGGRLKHVRENNMVHGQWEKWCTEECGISPGNARKYIRVFERFSNRSLGTDMGMKKMDMLAEFTDEQLETPVELPSGEQKKPLEMSLKEIEQLKRDKAEAERRVAQAEATAETERNSAHHFEQLWNKAKNQPPVIKTETKVVEKIPDDYQELKQQSDEAQRLRTENIQIQRAMMQQKEDYEQRLTKEEKRVAINRDLRKACKELLQNHSMYASSIVYGLSQATGEREAMQIVEAFELQYQQEVQKLFAELKQMTAVRTVS